MSHTIFAGLLGLVGGAVGIKVLAWLWGKLVALLPSAEKAVDAKLDASALGKHALANSATKLLIHHLLLLFQAIGSKAIADAVANGSFNAALATRVKADILSSLKSLVSMDFVLALAKELGFVYSSPTATIDAVMTYCGHVVDVMIQNAAAGKPLAATVPQTAPTADVPTANPSKASAPA